MNGYTVGESLSKGLGVKVLKKKTLYLHYFCCSAVRETLQSTLRHI